MYSEKILAGSSAIIQDVEDSIAITIDSANITAASNGDRIVDDAQLMASATRFTGAEKLVKYVAWSVGTGHPNANSNTKFTQKKTGVSNFNPLTIEFINPGTANQPLFARVEKPSVVSIYLQTNASSQIVTTGSQIVNLVNNHPIIKDLLLCELQTGNDGSGVVAATTGITCFGGNYPVGYLIGEYNVRYGDMNAAVMTQGTLTEAAVNVDIPGIFFKKIK